EPMHATHVVDAVHVDLPWGRSRTLGVGAAVPQWRWRLRPRLRCATAALTLFDLTRLEPTTNTSASCKLVASSLQEALFKYNVPLHPAGPSEYCAVTHRPRKEQAPQSCE